MPQVIPVTNDASQQFNTLGYTYLIQWNSTSSTWHMSISQNGVLLIAGIALVIDIFLLQPYALLIGDYLVINNESQSVDPGRDAWDDGSFSLIYFTEEERDAIISETS